MTHHNDRTELMNDWRARRGRGMLADYMRRGDTDWEPGTELVHDLSSSLADMLADVMHGLGPKMFEAAVEMARVHYRDEIEQEACLQVPTSR